MLKLIISFLVLFVGGASLAAIGSPDAKINQLAQDLEVTKNKLVESEVRQRKIMSSLFAINKKMKKIVSEKFNLTQEQMLLEANNAELALKIAELETKVKTAKSYLRERMSVIYRFGDQGVARLLFSSSSSAELERNLKILGIVAKRDLDLLKNYSASVRELDAKKTKLQNRLAHLRKIESRIKNKEIRLSNENNVKNKILDGLRKSKSFAMIKFDGLRQKSNQILQNDDSGVLDLLFRPSFFEQKAKLDWPVKGPIVKNFGLIQDEEENVTLSQKGVVIHAAKGTPVRSVFSGQVSYVGKIPGFGRTLIIDHGDHYFSVYSYNQDISVKLGDEIQKNQIIASVGTNPEDLQDGLYFEIRHFSEPSDPRSWVKGSL